VETIPIRTADPVRSALDAGRPVVALESTLITHGFSRPLNLEIALELESIEERAGAVPATVGIIGGEPVVGLTQREIELLSGSDDVRKCSLRDLGIAAAGNELGATTVASTIAIAAQAGLRIFATGGIGGVHRGDAMDVSADLEALAVCPLIVVCAGAKAILDIPRTLEVLETKGVPVIGYRTEEFPAFYTRSSGITDSVDTRCDLASEIPEIAIAHWAFGMRSALLVVQPVSAEEELPPETMNAAVEVALVEAEKTGVKGKELTPYLLAKVASITEGQSRNANLSLLRGNARLAAEIAGCGAGKW